MKVKHKFTPTLGLPIVEFSEDYSEDYLDGYSKAIFDVLRIIDKHANKYAGDIEALRAKPWTCKLTKNGKYHTRGNRLQFFIGEKK